MDCVVSLMKNERCQVRPVPLVSPLNELVAPRTSPLHPQQQTSSDRTGMSARCPIVLKSLFSSLLRLQLLLIRRNEGADFIRDV
jgi:hypothetical protein